MLLVAALGLLCAAAAIGGALAMLYLREPSGRPAPGNLPLALPHAALGIAGLAALALLLRHGLPPSAMGTAGFGPTAAALLGAALLCGVLLGGARWRRQQRPSELLVGLHAGFAIAGIVVLVALLVLR